MGMDTFDFEILLVFVDGILELKASKERDEGGDNNETAGDEGGELWNKAGVDIGDENGDEKENSDNDEN